MKKIIFTIVSNNYLGSALSLYDSVLKHCSPDIDFACVISDRKINNIKYDCFKFKVIWPDDFLEKDIINEMAFKYDVVEFNTALKPYAINYLMQKLGYNRIYYFDPDTYLFDNIESIEINLDTKDIVLTPHIVDCIIGTKYKDNEEAILRNGIYNLGFFGINKTLETEELIRWWMSKLKDQCYNDKSYFVDQKWMNFITAYSDSVCVLRNKIYNMAKWNYHERSLSCQDGVFFVGENRLCFFHFSGYKSGDIASFIEQEFPYSNYKEALMKLFNIYQEELIKNNFNEYRSIQYSYNFYENGMVVSKLNRRIYRRMIENDIQFNDPFKCGEGSFYSLMKRERLLSGVYKTSDLKKAISSENTKDKFKWHLNKMMKIIEKIIGARRYELLLNYFNNYCTINDQTFLVAEKHYKGENK